VVGTGQTVCIAQIALFAEAAQAIHFIMQG
jgi:hypothetical protein